MSVERFDGMMTTDMHNIMRLLSKTHKDVENDIVEAIEREQKPGFDYDKYDTDGLPYLVRYLDSLDDTEERSLWSTAVSLYDNVELWAVTQ